MKQNAAVTPCKGVNTMQQACKGILAIIVGKPAHHARKEQEKAVASECLAAGITCCPHLFGQDQMGICLDSAAAGGVCKVQEGSCATRIVAKSEQITCSLEHHTRL